MFNDTWVVPGIKWPRSICGGGLPRRTPNTCLGKVAIVSMGRNSLGLSWYFDYHDDHFLCRSGASADLGYFGLWSFQLDFCAVHDGCRFPQVQLEIFKIDLSVFNTVW